MSRLNELHIGCLATIDALDTSAELAQRLSAMGLRSGQQVEIIRKAPLGGPLHIRLGTTDLILRKQDAEHIIVMQP